MRQGSILSPSLFNIFLDELLVKLQDLPHTIGAHDMHLNSVAYADDITVFSPTVPGLQTLIDTCQLYASKYRFKFGTKKSKCIVLGKPLLHQKPTWKLGDFELITDTELEILGVTFNQDLTYDTHVNKRIQTARRRMLGLTSIGMSYPGLAADVKAYLWNSIGAPTMLYGMDSILLSNKALNKLKSTQGSIIKKAMGFYKRSHHSSLLQAMKIPPVTDLINRSTGNLFHRIFQVESPARTFQCRALANYLVHGDLIKNSLLDRVVKSGYSPFKLLSSPPAKVTTSHDGLSDSIRYLLLNDNSLKPYSDEHFITSLLLKAF